MSNDLELRWETPVAWARHALEDPLALLADHAHCELGAAAAAQSLIARVHRDAHCVDRLSALASEEMRHFRRVHRLLVSLGGSLGPVRKNPYVIALHQLARNGEQGWLDRFLIAALIERRSHERFRLLAQEAEGPLAELFRRLEPSEAGHARLFLELARGSFPAEGVEGRLAGLAREEAHLLSALPFAPRVHSGPPREASAVDQRARRAPQEASRP